MDRRQSPRWTCNLPARLTLLGEKEEVWDVLVEGWGKSGMSLEVQGRVQPGVACKVECDDALFLGEVIHCSPTFRGYRCGLKIEQCLTPVSGVKRLMEALVAERAVERTPR